MLLDFLCNKKMLGIGDVHLDADESLSWSMYLSNKSYKLDLNIVVTGFVPRLWVNDVMKDLRGWYAI